MEETAAAALPETSVTLSIPELILAVTEKTSLAKEEVETVVHAFIEYYLKRFKLK